MRRSPFGSGFRWAGSRGRAARATSPRAARRRNGSRPPALRGRAFAALLEHPVYEDRQFVERQHRRPRVPGQRREHGVAPLAPVAGVDPGAEFHPQFGEAHLFDPVADALQRVGERARDPPPGPLRGPRPDGDLRDGVRGAGGVFEIDEDRLERALLGQPPQRFPNQARLAHPALRGQQRVGSLPRPLREGFEFRLAVEKPLRPLDPVRAGLGQRHRAALPTKLLATMSLATISLSSGRAAPRNGFGAAA